MKGDYDIIVIGAGPAGCCAATLLAQQGHDVLLIEKEKFPRYHVGESLIPETYWPLERLGLIDEMKQSGFVKKYSVQFFNEAGKPSKPFYFHETNPHESAQTWQVTRADFDLMLMNNARRSGCEVVEATEVCDVLMKGEQVLGVVARGADGPPAEIRARVTVDASGMHALLSRKLKIRNPDPRLRKASVYTFYKGAHRDEGEAEGATLIIHSEGRSGWFWYIPLADDMVSVGVVSSPEELFEDGERDRMKILERQIAKCAPIRERVAAAEQTGEIHACTDYSWRSTRVAGDGYVLVGDAFGFLDPVYSSGVFLALKSGEMAADAIHDALAHNDLTAARLGAFGEELYSGMEAFRKIVYAFYTDGFSFGRFLKEYPEYKEHVIDLLVGNVFRPGIMDVFEKMASQIDLPETRTLAETAAGESAQT
ncbi:MAG: NAD(P)/FAD-dependent oxidoreductase [Verrucomicrobia bacterium]|nr:NAD(P)/FAD-dependent oxidoreductase [Verrucomicrobiota bacterium]MDA1087868.1 NAD(P)/FAD-dependent oxidoreductase [Verrucomicrobiota bacterium]